MNTLREYSTSGGRLCGYEHCGDTEQERLNIMAIGLTSVGRHFPKNIALQSDFF